PDRVSCLSGQICPDKRARNGARQRSRDRLPARRSKLVLCRARRSSRPPRAFVLKGVVMSVIKPRTRGKRLAKHRTRLDYENNETLYAYAQSLGQSTEYELNRAER